MRVLGIDPGTIKMGYGVVSENHQLLVDDYGVISLPKTVPLERRLYQLYTHVVNLIGIFSPTAIAVEEPFVGKGERLFARSAIAVGQAQALVLIGAAGAPVPVFRYPPAQVKLAVTDYGAATKEQMRQTIAATLGLSEIPGADAADALSVALCHLVQLGVASALTQEIPPGMER